MDRAAPPNPRRTIASGLVHFLAVAALISFTDRTLRASNVAASALNRVETDFPTLLEPNDDSGLVAAQGAIGGLRIGAWPSENSDTIHELPAEMGGRIFLPCAGQWVVRVLRYGTGAAGDLAVPFTFHRLQPPLPLERGVLRTYPTSRQPVTSSVNLGAGSQVIVTLSNMLGVGGASAVSVNNPGTLPIRLRWGSPVTGILWDLDLAAGARYTFKGEELPLADLSALELSGVGTTIKVTRWIR